MPLNYPSVNNPETTIDLKCRDFFIVQPLIKKSPIDEFFEVCTNLVKLTRPDIINENPAITRLLLLGYVSAVEEYLRSIFCNLINLCPYARSNAANKQIKFGSIDYYEKERLPEGIFEASSFASFEEINKKTKDLLGIDIKQGSSLFAALEKFDKICQLRHCAVHSGGTLNGYNAQELGLTREYVKSKLQPDGVKLQEALMVCYSFVRAYNQYIFNKTIQKWIDNRKLTGIWQKDKKDFTKLLDIFWSLKDISNRPKNYTIYKDLIPKNYSRI